MNVLADKRRGDRDAAKAARYSRTLGSSRASLQLHDSRPVTMNQGQWHERLNQSPKVESQIQLQQALNRSPRVVAQTKLAQTLSARTTQLQPGLKTNENRTGLPDQLKSGIENLSGMAMDDLHVHYNSPEPERIKALAYTQGTTIHVGPGQEKHLAHEAWHAVQQKQGRVQPTLQTKGVAINDDTSLEREADVMGARAARGPALQMQANERSSFQSADGSERAHYESAGKGLDSSYRPVVQAVWNLEDDTYTWTPNIDGVTWFADKDSGLMWFRIANEEQIREGKVEDYRRLEGKKNLRTWQEWNLISVRPVVPDESEEFRINERRAEWGSVYEVAPGIGVEVMKGEDPSYAKFISQQLHEIGGAVTGRALLQQFDPRAIGAYFRQVKDQEGPYRGLTVVIGQPQEMVLKNRNIQTGEFGGRAKTGKPAWDKPQIPRINFFQPSEKPQEIGASGAFVTSEGIVGHKDFPRPQPFDVVLLHEFIHAYLSQLGVAKRLRELGQGKTRDWKPLFTQNPDAVEEQLVVGILGGKGLPFAENVYRQGKGYEPRTTYKAVEIMGDKDLEAWLKTGINVTSIYRALIEAGLGHEQAQFVAGGPDL
jgi:hypothetical protein